MTVQAQKQNVPLGTVTINGQRYDVFITPQHAKPLEDVVKAVNDILARLEAASIP